jgi:hypothetical protein
MSMFRSLLRNRWSARFLALALGTAVGLLLVESIIRVAGWDCPLLWKPHPELGWRSIPGAYRHFTEEGDGQVHINLAGFRDRERTLEKPPGVFRIGVFGDSMTEAVQVNLEDTYCQQLQQRFGSDSAIEVLNFGVTGYSTVQELLNFRKEASRWALDVVVLGVFLDNDVACCHPATNTGPGEVPFRVEADEFDFTRPEASVADYHREPFYTLRRWTATYRAASYWMQRKADVAAPAAGIKKRFQLYQPNPSDDWEKAWGVFERTVVDFANEARRKGIQPVILSLPAAQVVDRAAWLEICQLEFPTIGAENWDLEVPERRLQRLAEKHSLPLCQPLKPMQHAPQSPPFFFGRVGHMTARGHRFIADELFKFLDKLALKAESKVTTSKTDPPAADRAATR